MRRLSYAELREWVGGDVEVEQLERSTGRFRRRTRVMTLYRDRRGIAPERPLGGNSAL